MTGHPGGPPHHARPRPPRRAVAGAVALVGALAAAAGAVHLARDAARPATRAGVAAHRSGTVPAPPGTAPVTVRPAATAATAARPRRLTIPAIGVDTPLETLGLGPSGALDPPKRPSEAGWYGGGPVPGATGPAVIAGHVDSLSGPAVFSRLSLLRVDDTVRVTLDDGRSARFLVTAVRRYPKDGFPTSAVYGPRPDPELRLITCGGTFTGHAYLDNVVVYARRSD